MSRQIQIRRGTVAQHETFIGAPGEITFDGQTLRVHDGTTRGGIILARTDEITNVSPIPETADYVIEAQEPTAQNNYTWYRKYKSGWVEQGGMTNFDTTTTIPVTMANTNYTVIITAASGIGGSGVWTEARTNSTFKARGQNYGGGFIPAANTLFWHASGYAA